MGRTFVHFDRFWKMQWEGFHVSDFTRAKIEKIQIGKYP